MGSVQVQDANFAAAILNTLRQLGMTIGIAVLGTAMTVVSTLSQQQGNSLQSAELMAFHVTVMLMGGLFLLSILFMLYSQKQASI